jgi:hypothetical protein
MASSLNKHKYANEEVEDSTVTSKKRWPFGDDDGDDSDDGDDDSSSSEEVSSEEEPPRVSLLRRQ